MTIFELSHNGFVALSDKEYDATKPCIQEYTHEFLEYGESKEDHWTRDKFITHIHCANEMADINYPKKDGTMCGYLITVAARSPRQMMFLTLTR